MGRGDLGVDESALGAFLARVQTSFPLERALLFGSRARGDELCESDYDVLLVSAAFEGMRFTERLAAVRDLWTHPGRLEALCYTPAEFERKRREIGIVAEAVREGRDLPLPPSARAEGSS
jgi:hypothetical protein